MPGPGGGWRGEQEADEGEGTAEGGFFGVEGEGRVEIQMDAFQRDDLPARELYALLHLSPDASDDDIKKSYRQWAQVYHPDKHQTPQVSLSIPFFPSLLSTH